MIGYVYYQGSKIICGKLDNVTSVKENQIISGRDIIMFGDGQDYIILQSDTVNKNIGDVIDLTKLEDCRDFFLEGKDVWYLEQINKSNNKNAELQTNINNQNELVNSLIEMVITTTLPTT